MYALTKHVKHKEYLPKPYLSILSKCLICGSKIGWVAKRERKQDRLGSKKVTDAFNFPSGVSLYLKHVKQNMIIYSSFKMKTLGIAWHARV